MRTDIAGKEKKPPVAAQKKSSDPTSETLTTSAGVMELPVCHPVMVQPLEKTQEHEQRSLAEQETEHIRFCNELTASFAEKEKKLIAELEATHQTQYRTLQQAAERKEQHLRAQLRSARQQILIVSIVAVVLISAILAVTNTSTTVPLTRTEPPASNMTEEGTAQDASPLVSTPIIPDAPPELSEGQLNDAVAETTEAVVAAPIPTGNGGNFPGGQSAGN